MPNYRISIDLSDLVQDLNNYDLREYRLPFCLYFVEAANPDEACSVIMNRVMNALMKIRPDIETRIVCRKVRRFMRIDRVECVK